MIPITRKELYLNKIVGNNDYETPEKPITIEEFFFAEILGEAVQAPEPLTRYQMYLAKIAGRNIEIPTPITRLEHFLARAAGMEIETPTPVTREEIFWSNYTAIVEFEVEGVPPLTYKAIEGTLKNYRIYGNTVNGESVGDRTGNLWDGELLQGYWASANGAFIPANNWVCSSKLPCSPNTTYTAKFSTLSRWYGYVWYDIDGNYISSTMSQETLTPTSPTIFTATSPSNAAYFGFNIAGAKWNTLIHPEDVADLMIVEGSTALPYEPYGYRVPVTINDITTNLYLPEQIKMVGDEAEYVDYKEQKQHRVRKNLLLNTAASQTISGVTFTVNSDRSVTCNGTANGVVQYEIYSFPRFSGECILSGCPMGGSQNTYRLQYTNLYNLSYEDYGTGVNIYQFDEIQYPTSKINIRIEGGYTCNNLTFYPMLRLASIEDDTYEPYIEDTELDAVLPVLPTITGTNTLSIGTEVQPSKVYIKGEKRRD